jgi:hypothetical protein
MENMLTDTEECQINLVEHIGVHKINSNPGTQCSSGSI